MWKQFFWLAAAACLFFVCSVCKAETDNTLTVGWDHWPPYQWADAQNNMRGLNVEVITLVLAKAGFKPRFLEVPWKRQMRVALKSGEIDIALGAYKTPAREQFAYFSDIYYLKGDNALFIRKTDEAKFSSIKSLRDIIATDFRLGTTRGAIYSFEHAQLLQDRAFALHVSEVTNDKQNIKKLLTHRIDGFLAGELIAVEEIIRSGAEAKIKLHMYLQGEESERESSYLMFSKASMTEAQVAQINRALKELKANASLQKIISKYQLPRSQSTPPLQDD